VNERSDSDQLGDLQATAWLASAAVVLGFAIYWWGEVQSVLELLEMAYG
jgi:hypothetical protein